MGEPINHNSLRTDAWGRVKAVSDFSLIHGLFTFDVPQSMWFQYEDGAEVSSSSEISSINGELVITGGTTERRIDSREHARYQPNRGMLFSSALFIDNADGEGKAEFGTSRFFFRWTGDKLYMVRKTHITGTGYVGAAEEFPLSDELKAELVAGKGLIYDIQAQLRMVGNIMFAVAGSGGYEFRTMDLLGTLDNVSSDDPAVSMTYGVTSPPGGVSIRVGCGDLTSEGGMQDIEQYASYTVERTINGNDLPVAVIKQPDTINGKENTRDIRLARITVTSDKKGNVSVWRSRDATALTGASFASINNGSYVEGDSSSTALNQAKASLVVKYPINANLTESIDNPFAETIQYQLVHGDYLIVAGSGATAAFTVVVEWGERV